MHLHHVDGDAAGHRGARAARALLLRAGAGDAPGDDVVRLAGRRHCLDGDTGAAHIGRAADARGVVNDADVDGNARGDAGAVAAAAAATATPTSTSAISATAAAVVASRLRHREADRLGEGVGLGGRAHLHRAARLDDRAVLDLRARIAREHGDADRGGHLDRGRFAALRAALRVLALAALGLVVALADLAIRGGRVDAPAGLAVGEVDVLLRLVVRGAVGLLGEAVARAAGRGRAQQAVRRDDGGLAAGVDLAADRGVRVVEAERDRHRDADAGVLAGGVAVDRAGHLRRMARRDVEVAGEADVDAVAQTCRAVVLAVDQRDGAADRGVAGRLRAGARLALQVVRRVDLHRGMAELGARREGDAVFHFGARLLDVDVDRERGADAEALAFAARGARHRRRHAVGDVRRLEVDVAAAERHRRGAALHHRLVRKDADADRDRAGDAGVAAARAGARLGPEHARRLGQLVRAARAAGAERDRLAGKRVLARRGELAGVVAVADDVVLGAVREAADVVRRAGRALIGDGVARVQDAALAEIHQAVTAARVENDWIGGEEAGAEDPRLLELVAAAGAGGVEIDGGAGVRVRLARRELDLAVAGVDDPVVGVVGEAADRQAARIVALLVLDLVAGMQAGARADEDRVDLGIDDVDVRAADADVALGHTRHERQPVGDDRRALADRRRVVRLGIVDRDADADARAARGGGRGAVAARRAVGVVVRLHRHRLARFDLQAVGDGRL